MSFKDDVKLDIFSLDEAALNQVTLYEEWSNKWANAILRRDKLKEKISVERARIEKEIRSNPEAFGWENSAKSPTEGWYATQVTLNEELIQLGQDLIDAQYEVNLYSSAKETLDHRRKSIEILKELYSSNYFNVSPKIKDMGEEYHKEQTRQKIEDEMPTRERKKQRGSR